MPKLENITITPLENGYVVEDFYNTKVFCKDKLAVMKQLKKVL